MTTLEEQIAETARLNRLLQDQFRASKTIYALVVPETLRSVDRILDGAPMKDQVEFALTAYFNMLNDAPIERKDIVQASEFVANFLNRSRAQFYARYTEAWTGKQDTAHRKFFETWENWIRPVVKLESADFLHKYPTAGASEPIRHAIFEYAERAYKQGFEPVIHIFEGEYEGYEQYAKAAGVEIRKHDRTKWEESIGTIGAKEEFYLSHPSAIDGCVWKDYDKFMGALLLQAPMTKVKLDLTYVGAVAKNYNIDATHPNIETIFFSLSKPGGMYYFRSGGCISKRQYYGLYGNQWFKSIMALAIGVDFMESSDVYNVPRLYQPVRDEVCENVAAKIGIPFAPADINMVGIAKPSNQPTEFEKLLTRGSGDNRIVRVCLTPGMTDRIWGQHPDFDVLFPLTAQRPGLAP